METLQIADLFNQMDKFLLVLAHQYGVWIYVTLFAIFFAETGLVFMAFLPGDSLLFVAGAVAATGAMHPVVLMLVIISGAVLGNTLNYYIGAWLGPKIFTGKIRWLDQDHLRRTHDFYERHGGKTVMIARFIPVVRTFAPLVAGAAGMTLVRFQLYNVLGAVIWVVVLVGGGYLFGNVPFVKDNLGTILVIGILGALGPMTLLALWKWAQSLRARPSSGG